MDLILHRTGQLQRHAFCRTGLFEPHDIAYCQYPQHDRKQTDPDIQGLAHNPQPFQAVEEIEQPQAEQQIRQEIPQ